MKTVSGSFQSFITSASGLETYSRIEKPTTDPVEGPSVDEQREAVNK